MWNVYCYGYCFMFWSCVYNNISGLTVLCWLIIRIICGDRWPAPAPAPHPSHGVSPYTPQSNIFMSYFYHTFVHFQFIIWCFLLYFEVSIPEFQNWRNILINQNHVKNTRGGKGGTTAEQQSEDWKLELYFYISHSNSPTVHPPTTFQTL